MTQSDDTKMSSKEAGQMGGEATRNEHGSAFYSEIGSEKPTENAGNFANRDESDVKEAGSRGGQASSHEA